MLPLQFGRVNDFKIQLRATGVTWARTIAHASSAQTMTMLMRRTDLLRSADEAANSQRTEATKVWDGTAVVSSRRKLAFLFAKGASSICAAFSISVRPDQHLPEESTNCPFSPKKLASSSEVPPFSRPKKASRVSSAGRLLTLT